MRIATASVRTGLAMTVFCMECGAWQAGDRKGRPYGELQGVPCSGRGRTPPLRMRYKGCNGRTEASAPTEGYKRCGEVRYPPVTASPYQPPLGKGAEGTGDTDCHSQCAHWLRNDSFLHGVWCMAGGRPRGSPLRRVTRSAMGRDDVGIVPYGSVS